ncbi:MAG TPA: hypothetical protein VGV64_04475 [Thermoplasmata archaeon]|nr:hypothetical protein [Thermoplasmata archaeon]
MGIPAYRPAPHPPLPTAQVPLAGSAPYRPSDPTWPMRLPSMPLLPGESVQREYTMDLAGFRRVVRRNLLILPLIVIIVFVPFMVLIAVQGGPKAAFGLALFGVLIALFAGMGFYFSLRVGKTAPTVVLVTNRRVLVENFGKDESSASMPLDNISDVVFEAGRNAKSAGVTWVYLLPIGATSAMVGSGRYRRAAPGVVWIPAIREAEAQELKSYVLSQARALQSTPRS